MVTKYEKPSQLKKILKQKTWLMPSISAWNVEKKNVKSRLIFLKCISVSPKESSPMQNNLLILSALKDCDTSYDLTLRGMSVR